jgi:O-antigen/teichoic acid export membrane protein
LSFLKVITMGMSDREFFGRSVLLKSSVWYIITSFLSKGIVFLMVPFYVRFLSKEEYGGFSNFISWLSILSSTTIMNLQLFIMKNKSEYEDRLQSFLFNVYLAILIVVIVIILPIVSFPQYFQSLFNMTASQFYMLIPYLLFVPMFYLYTGLLRAMFRVKTFVVANLLVTFSTAIFSVLFILIFQEERLNAFTVAQTFPLTLVGSIFLVMILFKGVVVDSNIVKDAFGMGLPMIPHILGLTIISKIDRVMITKQVGEVATAHYSVAANITLVLTTLSVAMNNAFVPWFVKQLEMDREEQVRKTSGIFMLTFTLIVLVFALIAPEIIYIWAGKNYAESTLLLPPLLISVAFTHFYTMYVNVEYYMESKKMIVSSTMIASLFNIVTNYFFIDLFGYQAAAYTTAASNLILFFLHYWATRRLNKHHLLAGNVAWLSVLILVCTVYPLTLFYKFTVARWIIAVMILIVATMFLIRLRKNKINFFRKGEKIQNV